MTYRWDAASSTWSVVCNACEQTLEAGYYALPDAVAETPTDHTCEEI